VTLDSYTLDMIQLCIQRQIGKTVKLIQYEGNMFVLYKKKSIYLTQDVT